MRAIRYIALGGLFTVALFSTQCGKKDDSSWGIPTISVSYGGSTISSGGSFSFGIVPVSFDAGNFTFTISNSGTGALVIYQTNISGANSNDFSLVSDPVSIIAEGSSSNYQVKFLPTSSGSKSATVTISSNDPVTSEYQITVRGSTQWGSTFVDGTSLNYDSGRNGYSPKLLVSGSKLYAIWQEFNGNRDQVRVALFNNSDSSPVWSFVDGVLGAN